MNIFLTRLSIACFLSTLLLGCGGNGLGEAINGASRAIPAGPSVSTVPQQAPILNSITLQSDVGDPLGQGLTYRYDPTNAKITMTAEKNRLIVQIEGDDSWVGVLQTGASPTELKVGEYRALERYSSKMDSSKSAMTWWANNQSCANSTGWLVIDYVEYSYSRLVAISFRFKNTCPGSNAGLNGEIKFNINDRTKPTSPLLFTPTDLWKPPASIASTTGNYAYFESTPGDYVGLGKTYLFDPKTATMKVVGSGHYNYAQISVIGDEVWTAEVIGVEARLDGFSPGYYPSVKGSRFHNPTKGGISWTAAGRGCSESIGWIAIDAVSYDNIGNITKLDLRFEQHCEGREAPLRGAIHYNSAADTSPTPNISTPGSWRAPADILPSSDNFLYMQSGNTNELLLKGVDTLQTSKNAAFEVSAEGKTVQIYGKGNQTLGIQFTLPDRLTQVVAGSYDISNTAAANSAGSGPLYVTVGSYGCQTQKGWVVVDNATYVAGKLTALEFRFEQLCDSAQPQLGLLHGHMRWRSDVASNFPGPVTPPSTFWKPAPSLPTGTYIYLNSDRSDFLGDGGGDFLYTPIDSVIRLTEKDGRVDIDLRGDTFWSSTFETMSANGKIQPGYYAALTNGYRPARGSFSWSGDGRGCNTSTSGVVVDKALYENDKLIELKLRFEQHCNNEPGALRGEVHWLAADNRQPSGPTNPIPSSLWRAPSGALPANGNYLYIESGPGDPIGGGKTYTLTQQNASFSLSTFTNYHNLLGAYFVFNADTGTWDGGRFTLEFQTMSTINQLQVGFYDHTLRYPFHNTAFGGLTVSSLQGGGCNESIGWVALDRVVYSNGRLTSVHGRFLQHCDRLPPTLYGEFNWEG